MPGNSNSDPSLPAMPPEATPEAPPEANGSQRMAIMKDETVTRFRRETRTPLQTPTAQDAAPEAGPWDDGLPDLSRQHVAALHRIYDPILNEPIPDRMLTLLRRYTR